MQHHHHVLIYPKPRAKPVINTPHVKHTLSRYPCEIQSTRGIQNVPIARSFRVPLFPPQLEFAYPANGRALTYSAKDSLRISRGERTPAGFGNVIDENVSRSSGSIKRELPSVELQLIHQEFLPLLSTLLRPVDLCRGSVVRWRPRRSTSSLAGRRFEHPGSARNMGHVIRVNGKRPSLPDSLYALSWCPWLFLYTSQLPRRSERCFVSRRISWFLVRPALILFRRLWRMFFPGEWS